MSEHQSELMKFDPATGDCRPYPSHAGQWREWRGNTAWLFDPWGGRRRRAEDVGSDPYGLLIVTHNNLETAQHNNLVVYENDESSIDAMVARFLCWKLPRDFAPDAGITFCPPWNIPDHLWPTGTNLLTAEQARAMIESILTGKNPQKTREASHA